MVDIRHFEYFIGSGNPVPGAVVEIQVASLTQPNPNPVIASTTTNANGMWQVLALASGDYDVVVTYSGRKRKRFGLSVSPLGFDLTDSDIAAAADIQLTKLDGAAGLLNEALDPATITYTTLKDRLDGFVSQFRRMGGGANWHTAPASTIAANTANITALLARAPENHAVNPGFEVWQRGTAFASNGYTADRWILHIVAPSVGTANREATTVDSGSRYSMYVNHSTAGGALVLQQLVESAHLRGKQITFAVRVNTTVVGSISLRVNTTVGGVVASSAANSTTGWQTLSCTGTINAAETLISLEITIVGAVANIYLDNAQFVVGSSAPPWSPPDPTGDLARCLRYYERHPGALEYALLGDLNTTTVAVFDWKYRVAKGGLATVTYGTAANWIARVGATAAAPSALASISNAPEHNLFNATFGAAIGTAGQACALSSNGAAAVLIAEWNP